MIVSVKPFDEIGAMKRLDRAAGTVVAALLLLFGALGMGCKDSGSPGPPSETAAGPPPAQTVDAREVVAESLRLTLEAVGSLEAAEDVRIAAMISEIVREILFEEGDPVREGTVLIRLDDVLARLEREKAVKALEQMKAGLARMEAEVKRAQAVAENEQSHFRRKQDLYDQGAATEAVLLDAKTEFATAEATLEKARAETEEMRRSIREAEVALQIAEERLDRCTIRAPLDGVLGERFVGPGDFVDPGDPLVSLLAVDPLKVSFTLPERHTGLIRMGQVVDLTVDAWPGRVFQGEVVYIAPELNAGTRSIKVKARVNNEEGLLRPGFFSRVRLVLGLRENALVIPEEAIVPRGERFFVYTVEEGAARLEEVKPGQRLAGRVEILEGLEEGDRVVTAGQQRVVDGTPVRIRTTHETTVGAEEGEAPPGVGG